MVYPATIAAHVAAELPFMATENILMAAVQAGGDRQDLHERLRRHSQAAAEQVKVHGRPNDLLDRIKNDAAFDAVDVDELMDPGGLRRPGPAAGGGVPRRRGRPHPSEVLPAAWPEE